MAQLKLACCSPPPRFEYAEQGKEEHLAGVDVYVNWPDSSTATSAILLASDVHGWKVPQLRKIADAVAAAGLVALVPDFFRGDPFIPNPDGSYYPEVDIWMEKHAPVDSVVTVQQIYKEVATRGIKSFGISGYCWGAKLGVEVEKVEQTKALVSLVLLHPSFVEAEELRVSRAPIALLLAELDEATPPEIIKAYKAALDSREEDSVVKVFLGIEHGWTTRYDPKDEAAVKAADEACQDMISWHNKYKQTVRH